MTKGTVLMDNVYRKGDEGIIEQICSYRNEDKLLTILLISLCVTKKNMEVHTAIKCYSLIKVHRVG